jgi:hypothetical protein
MFVKCDSHNCYRLIKGIVYKVVKETETEYHIKLSKDINGIYNKKDFTPIKEEVMKIKDWKELDGVLSKYNVKCERGVLLIYNSNLFVSKTDTTTCEKQIIIDWLKLYGIEVEFEKEMTITQMEWDMLNWYKHYSNAKIKRILSNSEVYIIKEDGWWSYIKNSDNLLTWLEIDKEYLVSDLQKMKVEVPT